MRTILRAGAISATALPASARQHYLAAVIDYNRSQFRLYWAMGQPSLGALAKMPPQALTTPVSPEAYRPLKEVPLPRNGKP